MLTDGPRNWQLESFANSIKYVHTLSARDKLKTTPQCKVAIKFLHVTNPWRDYELLCHKFYSQCVQTNSIESNVASISPAFLKLSKLSLKAKFGLPTTKIKTEAGDYRSKCYVFYDKGNDISYQISYLKCSDKIAYTHENYTGTLPMRSEKLLNSKERNLKECLAVINEYLENFGFIKMFDGLCSKQYSGVNHSHELNHSKNKLLLNKKIHSGCLHQLKLSLKNQGTLKCTDKTEQGDCLEHKYVLSSSKPNELFKQSLTYKKFIT